MQFAAELPAVEATVGPVPVVGHGFFLLAIVADLEGDVGVWVGIVEVAPFGGGVEFDKNFFIIPGAGFAVGLLVVPAEGFKIGLALGKVALDELGDFFGVAFESFDVKIDLGADHVEGGRPFWLGVPVVIGAPVAAGDDNFFFRDFLNMVEEVDQNRVDVLGVVDNGK